MALYTFINQCLQEDKYGHKFVEDIESRLEVLNYSQLKLLQKAFIDAKKNAKFGVWKEANDEILTRVARWYVIREKAHNLQLKVDEELQFNITQELKKKEVSFT